MLPEKRLIRSWPKGDRPRPVCSGLPAVPRCPPGQFHGGLEPSGARHPLCLPEGGAFLPPDLRHSPGPRLGSPQTPLPRDGTPLPSGPQQPGQGGRLIPLQWAVGQDRPQPCRTFRLFRPLPGLQNRPCLSGSRLPLPLCFDPVFPIPGRLFGPGASLRLRRAARRLRPLLGSAGQGRGDPLRPLCLRLVQRVLRPGQQLLQIVSQVPSPSFSRRNRSMSKEGFTPEAWISAPQPRHRSCSASARHVGHS